MRVEVRVFAMARQVASRDSVVVELPTGARVRDLRERLAATIPALAALLARSRIAVNAEYAADESVIPPGAELACIPPVSGG